MKAIIIDDEKHVREGLLFLAEWDKFGIETIIEAEDGEEAIRLIKEHQPDIIFTDMNMPKRDGISLLKWIYSANLTTKTIVISGYDNFEYMRNAIQYKSFDYILKPIDPDILNETLEKAVKELKEQEYLRKAVVEENKVLNEVKPLYWDRLFSGILTNTHFPDVIVERISKEFRVNIKTEKSTVAVITINKRIINQFQGDIDLAFFTVSNICNELLRKKKNGISFRNINKEREIVLLFWNQSAEPVLMDEIWSLIFQFTRVKCRIAVGKQSEILSQSYESAQQVLMNHNLVQKNYIVTEKDVCTQPLLFLLDYSEEIKWAVQSGSFEQIDRILAGIYNEFEVNKNCLTLAQLEIWTNQYNFIRENWLKEYEIPSSYQINQRINFWEDDGTFSYQKFKEEKRTEFYDLLSILSEIKYQKEKNNMQKIEEYLRKNYNKEINLQDIAERFFLSREYISRKFKQEFDETITDYLAKIRIDQAKDLLENPHLKIYDISYLVGYQNEKYFSKVFKKITGQSPNEYRTLVLQNNR